MIRRWLLKHVLRAATTLALAFVTVFTLRYTFLRVHGDGGEPEKVVPAGWPFLSGNDISEDEELIGYVKSHVFIPPSDLEYNLSNPGLEDSSEVQVMSGEVIPKFLNGVVNGTFVEGGVLDGEHHSATLILERKFGWKGLIYEMSPLNKALVLAKHRKATFAPVCVSMKPWPEKKYMNISYNDDSINSRVMGQIVEDPAAISKGVNSTNGKSHLWFGGVECFPIRTLLLAAGLTRVDFMRLDVEGFELKVLKTIPWDKFVFRVISLDLIITHEGVNETVDYLKSQGYRYAYGGVEPAIFVNDNF